GQCRHRRRGRHHAVGCHRRRAAGYRKITHHAPSTECALLHSCTPGWRGSIHPAVLAGAAATLPGRERACAGSLVGSTSLLFCDRDPLMDGSLIFPVATPPTPGTTTPIAPGIRWLRMRLPFALDHINLWLLEDGDGWTAVDTGFSLPETKAAWQQIFA